MIDNSVVDHSMTIRKRVTLLAVILAAFALRLYQMDAQGLWSDEALSFSVASMDTTGILDYARSPFHHPPVYFFLLAGWMHLAGDSEFSMRFLSLFFSTLTVVLVYGFARRWFSDGLARWSIVLAALSPFGIVYAQEVRMYMLAVCVSLLALDYCLRWLEQRSLSSGLIALALILIGLSIHYYTALLLLVADLYVVLVLWRRFETTRLAANASASPSQKIVAHHHVWIERILVPWLIGNLLIVLLLGSWILLSSGPQATVSAQLSHPLFEGRDLIELQRNLVFLVLGGIVYRPLTDPELLLTAFLLSIVLMGSIQLWRSRAMRAHTPLLWLLLVVPPIAASPVPLNYNARYFFMSVPALILLVASALNWLQARSRPLFGVMLMAVLFANAYGIWFNYHIVKNAYRDMANVVTEQAHPTDALVLDGPHQEILANYYLRGPWERHEVPLNADVAALSEIDPPLRALQESHSRLWVVGQQASAVDSVDNVPHWLSLNAYPVSKQWFQYDDYVALFLSERSGDPPVEWNIRFGDWLVLESAMIARRSVNAGDGITVRLTWHALQPISRSERFLVTLRLFDAQGHAVQERVAPPCDGYCPLNNWLPGQSVEDRHGIIVPTTLPEGVYYLHLEIYQPQQGQSLLIENEGDDKAASLELAQISVVHPTALMSAARR